MCWRSGYIIYLGGEWKAGKIEGREGGGGLEARASREDDGGWETCSAETSGGQSEAAPHLGAEHDEDKQDVSWFRLLRRQVGGSQKWRRRYHDLRSFSLPKSFSYSLF